MIGEKILDRAEKRILGGWAKRIAEVSRDNLYWGNRVWHDGGADVAYCLTGAIGYDANEDVGKAGPGLRLVTDVLYEALPPGYNSCYGGCGATRSSRFQRIIGYNDSNTTDFDSILETIRRAKEILPKFQPGASNAEGTKASSVAS